MSKKLLSFICAVLGLTVSSFGQCTFNTSLTTPGYYPDSVTGLPPAIVTVPYNTVIQLKCPTDTVVSGFGTVHINYIQLDSVKGMPTGFTYAVNPSNGTFTNPPSPSKNGANGCVLITGTAVAGQETGGPTSNGKYPLVVYYHSNVTVPLVGTINQAGTNKYYHISILPASAGIVEENTESFTVLPNTPNPAGLHTDINFWMPSPEQVEFKVYDVLGNLITSRSIHSDKGTNKFTYDTSGLSAGIYLYSIRNGDKSISRRMIVASH